MDAPSRAAPPSRLRRWLLLAVLAGLLVRLPGVAWGGNWPDGFGMHHPDEYTHLANANAMITPSPVNPGAPYPKAMAALPAAPVLLWYAATRGTFGGPRVRSPFIVGIGRVASVIFGLAAVVLVFAIGRDAMGDPRAGVLGAWLLALGGLHVTQSHFFLADVSASTLTLLAAWLLWRDLERSRPGDLEALRWAAFAAGAAFAFKLFVFVLPALAYAVFARPPRGRRLAHTAVFAAAGIFLPALGFDGPLAFHRALTEGINYPLEFDRARAALLYAVQLPGILSAPLLAVGLAGGWGLLRRLPRLSPGTRRHALIVFGSVPAIGLAIVLLKLDHFPRHWVFVIPWAAVAGGWFLSRVMSALAARRRPAALVFVPVFTWMLAFVVDSERFFVFEPRNAARLWLGAHVPEGHAVHWTRHPTPPGYAAAQWPGRDRPDVLVIEMYEANNFLSGIAWRDSLPADPRQVFDGRTAERVAEVQALFSGRSEYVLAARFPATHLMPEHRLSQRLLGDRARTYITDVLIFRRDPEHRSGQEPGGS